MPITLIKSFVKSLFNRLGYEVTIRKKTMCPKKHKVNKPIKIEFIGPPGVGKTTIYEELIRRRKKKDVWLPVSFLSKQIKSIKLKESEVPEYHMALLEMKLNNVQGKKYSVFTKLSFLSYFFDVIKKDLILSKDFNDLTTVSDEGIVHNFSKEILELSKQNSRLALCVLKNTAIIYCYASAKTITNNVLKRHRETGRLLAQHRDKEKKDLMAVNKTAIENKEKTLQFLQTNNIPHVTLNTEEPVSINAQKVSTFINKLHSSHSQ